MVCGEWWLWWVSECSVVGCVECGVRCAVVVLGGGGNVHLLVGV